MNATFTGINVARRGLYASQAGLSVTNDNISNANTTGYSRQTLVQTSLTPAAVYNGESILGNGAVVDSVSQEHDFRLDQRYWQENTRKGEYTTKYSELSEMETILSSSSSSTSTSSGFSTVFNTFYSALETLKDNPSDSSTRIAFRTDAEEVCEYLNETSSRLTEIRSDENNAVKTTVDQINSYTSQIAALNQRISSVEAMGANANTLKDERTNLIDKLSSLTACTVTNDVVSTAADGTENTRLVIQAGGMTLVDGETSHELQVVQDSTNDDMYRVQWKDTGEEFTAEGGTLKAELDIRDGDGSDGSYKGVPYYISQLDTFAQTLAKAFNEGILADTSDTTYTAYGHASGYTENDTTGMRFFSYGDTASSTFSSEIASEGVAAAYTKITAANISLSAEVESDYKNIVTSSAKDEAENSTITEKLIDMLQDTALFNKGTPEDYYNSIVSTLATDSSTASLREENYSSMVTQLAARRTSVSGVDTNEETANMTKYQSAYEASSKMVSVWNKLYETTISMVNS